MIVPPHVAERIAEVCKNPAMAREVVAFLRLVPHHITGGDGSWETGLLAGLCAHLTLRGAPPHWNHTGTLALLLVRWPTLWAAPIETEPEPQGLKP